MITNEEAIQDMQFLSRRYEDLDQLTYSINRESLDLSIIALEESAKLKSEIKHLKSANSGFMAALNKLDRKKEELKAEIEQLKESKKIVKNNSLIVANRNVELSFEVLSLHEEIEQLKAIIHAKEVKADFNTYCELREYNKKLELEIYQIKSQGCNTCNLKDICLIHGSFNVRSCSNYEKMVTK